MKNNLLILALFCFMSGKSQELNASFNQHTEASSNLKRSIEVNGNYLKIKVKVIYNAIPDGYHITFTYSSISSTLATLEELTYQKKKSLVKGIKKLKMKPDDMVVDVISLDPIYSMKYDTSDVPKPTGFKSTHNVTFNISDIGQVDHLSRVCFEESIYDIVDITPYLHDVKYIEDSLTRKTIAVLNAKKSLAREIGFEIEDGKADFQKNKNTLYPSERYLKSYIQNTTMRKHHISQNSNINYNRKVDVDQYYNLDLRDADYVFNSKEVKPVIQFMYSINYGFLKRDREEEARLKQQREIEQSRKKDIYILDKKGRMRKAAF